MLGDADLKRIMNTVHQKSEPRNCYTMMDVLDGKIENNAMDAWKKCPLFQPKVIQNSAIADPTAGLIDIMDRSLEAVRPNSTGRMIAKVHETKNEKLKVRLKGKGKVSRTQRGLGTYVSYAGRNTFVELEPNKELVIDDEWDRNDMEDANWNIEADAMAGMAADMLEEETRVIVNFLDGVTTAQVGGTDNLVVKAVNTDLTADHVISGWSKAGEQDQEPDTLIVSKKGLGQLLQDDDFKDQTILGQFVDWSRGMFGMFLGMQVLVSSIHPADKAFILDSERAIQYALRRDRLMIPYDKPPHTWALNLSSRYDIKFGDPTAITPIRAS